MIIEIIYRMGRGFYRAESYAESLLTSAKRLHDAGAQEIFFRLSSEENAIWYRGCRKHVYAKTWDGGGTCNLELLHDGPCELKDDNYPGPREMSLTERKKAGWF